MVWHCCYILCVYFLLTSFYYHSEYSAKATDEYELARQKVANFINAAEAREIIFTRNATEAINLVAYSWGLSNLKPEDEVYSLASASLLFVMLTSGYVYSRGPFTCVN